MTTKFLILASLIFFSGRTFAQHKKSVSHKEAKATGAFLLKNSTDSLSYALGLNYANWLKQQGVDDINYIAFDKAITTILQEQTPLMDNKTAYMSIQEKLKALMQSKSAANLAAGEKFLAENKNKPGIITLPDGLQYQILQQGTGAKPLSTDKVKVNYEGRLIDGKVFDSSAKNGGPIQFGVSQVIHGWTEALQLMPAGSKWRLFIPASLAYGERGAGMIPPNSVLIFDVELLEIVK